MKTLKIYYRTILERTGYRNYPFKEIQQYTIIYNGKVIDNHMEKVNNPKLKVKFDLILETRKKSELLRFINNLEHKNSDKWLKKELLNILEEMPYFDTDDVLDAAKEIVKCTARVRKLILTKRRF